MDFAGEYRRLERINTSHAISLGTVEREIERFFRDRNFEESDILTIDSFPSCHLRPDFELEDY